MDVINKIKKVLKKRREDVIIDLYLKDYDKSNFYFALVFNKKIRKFKVLYVPIDAINSNDDIYEYFCYQFIFLSTVNYIMESLNTNCIKYKDINLDRRNPRMSSYYIEINAYVLDEVYKYTFTQAIDREFMFLFDPIVTLFEHTPNIVSELGLKILKEFNGSEIFKYSNSFEFDLMDCNLEEFFGIKKCKYSYDDIQFIESNSNVYYAVMDGELIIIEYSHFNKLVNVYFEVDDNYEEEKIYIIIKAIRDKREKKFYRLMVEVDDNPVEYYLCYGVDDDSFKVVSSNLYNRLELKVLKHEQVKIRNSDKEFENKLKEYLSETYEDRRVLEILNNAIIKES